MAPLHFNVKEHVIPCSYIREYPGATLENQEDILQLHVKQYKPKGHSHNPPGAVTIIGAHANGFPKELYEPFWDDLYHELKVQGQVIKNIWIADVAGQGRSGVLNENKLGNDPSWNDHPRDMLHMINHFRVEMPRPLVGIGHSMGGNQLAQLAYMHPRLLSSLVLIDPVIHDATSRAPRFSSDSNFARSSTFRRDVWPSREQAAASFRKHPIYQTWDPRVLDLWIEYGLRELPTALYPEDPTYSQESNQSSTSKPEGGPVTLTTSKPQEVLMYLRPNFEGKDAAGNQVVNRQTHPDIDLSTTFIYPFYRPEVPVVFKNLPHLRPSTLYLFGEMSELSSREARKQKLDITGTGVGGSGGVKEGRVKEVVLEGVGHLIPMVAPKDSGFWSADFLAHDLKRWRKEEEYFKRGWEARSRMERMSISEEWKKQIGGDPRVKSPQKL